MKRMKNFFYISLILAILLSAAGFDNAQEPCQKLSEAEVAQAVGKQLPRDATNPCRFGKGFNSFTIILHMGEGPGFAAYKVSTFKQFPDAQSVSGIGSDGVFFGGMNMAVSAKGNVVFVQMLLGHGKDEKLALSKAVLTKLLSHM
jgi:hypothetical protein